MKLAKILVGTFIMGSPAGEKGRYNDGGPQHRIITSKPLYMGIYEVT